MNAINDCEKALALSLKSEMSEKLTTDEQLFLNNHFDSCPQCKAEQLYLEKLPEGLSATKFLPGFEADELSRYRFINDIVEQADSSQSSSSSHNNKAIIYTFAVAAGAIAAILLITLGVLSGQFKFNQNLDKTVPQSAATQAIPISSVLLHSDLDSTLPDNNLLKTGTLFDSQNGQLAIKLTSRISFLMEKKSKAVLTQLDNNIAVITLLEGSIISTVEPNIKGRDYYVKTGNTSVKVTGTIFSVEKHNIQKTVKVLRGKVTVSSEQNKKIYVVAGKKLDSSSSVISNLSKLEQENMWNTIQVIDLLAYDDYMTTKLSSTPHGAAVTIDNKYMGVTPLTAKLRKGHRRILISKPGYHSIEGEITGTSGETIDNSYFLKAMEKPNPEPATVSAKTASKNRTVSNSESSQLKTDTKVLLSIAQKNKIQKQWVKAAEAYQHLINQYPKSGEANAARVSLGKLLHKKLNRPGEALMQFNNYLSRGGSLAQEALYGKALVLKDLGRFNEERETLLQFINRYPNAIASSSAQNRLEELK